MKITIEKIGDVTVATIPGDSLDASNAKEFKCDIAPILEANGKVLLDMSSLQFVDSSGLGAVLSCLRLLKSKGGDLFLCGMTRPVRTLFELVRLNKIFDIFSTREEAMATLGEQ